MALKLHQPRLVSAEDFLAMDFGDYKAELENGVIRLMAGGTRRHARVQGNIIAALAPKLRGTGCAAYTSDMAVQTRERTVRYPDVSVFCGRESPDNDADLVGDDPTLVFEILSDGTARTDLNMKLPEYKALPSISAVLFVDIEIERVRIFRRTGADRWDEEGLASGSEAILPGLDIRLTHDEIFARD